MPTAIVLALVVATTGASGPTCGMSHSFDQPDEGGTVRRPIWEDHSDHSLMFADKSNINTDGTKRSYSVMDFWGVKRGGGGAYNTLCNAMVGVCRDLKVYKKADGKVVTDRTGKPVLDKIASKQKLSERIALTIKAHGDGWPASELGPTRLARDVIAFDAKTGKPCPDVDGYLVSMTAYGRTGRGASCKLSDYVDALTIPAVVLPERAPNLTAEGASLGDLAVVVRPGDARPHYAVVGDRGPADEIGEVSVALAKELLNKKSDPENRSEILGTGGYPKDGWVVGRSFVLILGRSPSGADSDSKRTDLYYNSADRIRADAALAFQYWGGMPRMMTCMSIVK